MLFLICTSLLVVLLSSYDRSFALFCSFSQLVFLSFNVASKYCNLVLSTVLWAHEVLNNQLHSGAREGCKESVMTLGLKIKSEAEISQAEWMETLR